MSFSLYRPTRSASPAPARAPAQNTPAPAAAAPSALSSPMAPSGGGGMLSGIVGGVVQGMAFGTGSAIAHRAVDAVAGPRQVEHVHSGGEAAVSSQTMSQNNDIPCKFEKNEFERCVSSNSGNLDFCRSFFDSLSQCQKNSF